VAILKPLPQQALVKAELVQAGSATKLDMAEVELELELTVDGGTEELEDLVVVPELTDDEVEEAFVEVLLVFDVEVDVLLVEVDVLLVDVLVLEVDLWRTTKSPSRSWTGMMDPKTSGLRAERRKRLENFMMSKFEQKTMWKREVWRCSEQRVRSGTVQWDPSKFIFSRSLPGVLQSGVPLLV
jgi:hypothetical protein